MPLSFKWGALAEIYDFLPRLVFKDIILAKARWRIWVKDIQNILEILNSTNQVLDKSITSWKKKHKLPDWIQLVDGDNNLALNLSNLDCIKILFQSIKNRTWFILEEFVFHEDTVVKDVDGNSFANQIIFSFYKNHK